MQKLLVRWCQDQLRDEVQDLHEIRLIHQRNLRQLRKQAAHCGLDVPLRLYNAMRHEEKRIDELTQQIQRLAEAARQSIKVIKAKSKKTDGFRRVPCLGRVTAGLQGDAAQPFYSMVAVLEIANEPAPFVPREYARPGAFVVKVSGESAFGFGIHDSDLCLILPPSDIAIHTGDLVIALIQGEDSITLKRVVALEHGFIQLQAVDPDGIVESRVFSSQEVLILGKVIAVIRRKSR